MGTRGGHADNCPFSTEGWLVSDFLTHFPFCRGVSASLSPQKDSVGSFLLLSIYPMGLRAKSNLKHAPKMKAKKESNFL